MSQRRMSAGACVAAVVLLSFATGCKGKLERLRDSLASGPPESSAPRCAARSNLPACLDAGARYFIEGAKFDGKSPDQASAAALSLLVSDGHGWWLEGSGVWLAAMKTSKGVGADALRLSVAHALAGHAPKVAQALLTDDDAKRLFLAVSSSIPGACATYATLAVDANADRLPAADSPDHSSCVQADLIRTDGPGGAYGYGVWRAAAGALAVWKDAVRALEIGSEAMTGPPRAALLADVAMLKAATVKISAKKVDRPIGNRWSDADHAAVAPNPQ